MRLSRRLRTETTRVTRENGRSRAPYPPTTVSFCTNPPLPSRSASTTLTRVSGALALALGGGGRHGYADGGRHLLRTAGRVLDRGLLARVLGQVVGAAALGPDPDLRAVRDLERRRPLR